LPKLEVEQISHDEQKQYHLNRQGTTTAPETGRIRTGSAAEELPARNRVSPHARPEGERTIGDEKQPGGKAENSSYQDIVEDEPFTQRGWPKHQQ